MVLKNAYCQPTHQPVLTEFQDPRTFMENLTVSLPSLKEKDFCNHTFTHGELFYFDPQWVIFTWP